MAIDGSSVPGLIGWIDLTGDMDDFAKAFRDYGKNLLLHVRYPGDS